MNHLQQILSTVFFSALSGPLFGQQFALADHATFMAAYPLELATNKTTSIIFRSAIASVDKGSSDILAQKVKTSENILQIKAGVDGFEPTSLTVLTKDGRMYAFNVSYNACPEQYNIIMTKDTVHVDNITIGLADPVAIFSKTNVNSDQIAQAIAFIKEDKGRNVKLSQKNQKTVIALNGIYVVNDFLFLRFELGNRSYIDYDAEPIRFLIKDQQKYKRMATQEIEVAPLQTEGNITMIKGQDRQTVIIALPRFTIPDKKELIIQLMEHNGGRHLQLKVSNRILVKAKPVSF